MSIQSNLFLTYIHETFQNLKACCFGVCCWFWFCFFYPLGVYVSSHLLVLLIYQFSTDKRKPVAFSALEEIVALESALPGRCDENICAVSLADPSGRDNDCAYLPVSQALRENTYPFLAVIMLKDRRMTVVGRLEGLIQADDLINQLMFIMDANQTYLVSERLERYDRTWASVMHILQRQAVLFCSAHLLPPDATCRYVGQHLLFCNTDYDLSSSQSEHWSINSGDPVAGEFDVLAIQARCWEVRLTILLFSAANL